MKSNQECLPPKKREIPATSRPSEEKPAALTKEDPRAEGSAWASGAGGRPGPGSTSAELGLQQGMGLHKPLSVGLDYSVPSTPRSVPAGSTLPAVFPPSLAPSGTPVSPVQFAHLPHTFQFIGSSQYGGPYATGYLPSPLVSPTPGPGPAAPAQRSQLEAYSALLSGVGSLGQQLGPKAEPPLLRTPGLVAAGSPPPAPQNQYVHLAGTSPQGAGPNVSPPAVPVHLHPHPAGGLSHTLALGPSPQVVVQYSDAGGHFVPRELPRKAEGARLLQQQQQQQQQQQAVAAAAAAAQAKEVLNGEVDKGRRYGALPSAGGKPAQQHHHHHHHHHHHPTPSPHHHSHPSHAPHHHHYEARHVVVHPGPADYGSRDSPGVRASVLLLPGGGPPSAEPDPVTAVPGTQRDVSPAALDEQGGLPPVKPGPRAFAPSPQQALGPEGTKAGSALPPHTVIQTAHGTAEPLPVHLPATAFYTGAQPPVIGYLSGQQPALGYAAGLPPHLVIPGPQPLLIPVGAADGDPPGAGPPAPGPHAFVAAALPKGEGFGAEALGAQPGYPAAVVQAQIHLPVGPTSAPPPAAPPPALPPYFTKGSIIQLADGELKKVEELRTEDFIQSAEISSDLKIDSSTVERIEDGPRPGIALIQFAVGEHRAQVSVEVRVEYPFFVFGQGWSSCCPNRTSQLFDLPCSKLSVGDVCISLTLRELKNGSVKKGQPPDPSGLWPKRSRNAGLAGGRHRYGEQENGINQGSAPPRAENGELKFPEKNTWPAAPWPAKTEPSKPPATRKRRWSAPETRKLEKSEEEPPLTLPKPSFIPQAVKICIEGRSSVGK
ncbi:ataxin-1 [Tachyglossus aculeatus]|uniref:ataxin-1 n=1 Tax=Tachyglossus aculeatus TaxID=9261 RepID=UPI0018F2B497|nr:ataxin-1 [Tachyglossus aculeatus]